MTEEVLKRLRYYAELIYEGKEPMTELERAAEKALDDDEAGKTPEMDIYEAYYIVRAYYQKPQRTEQQWLMLEKEVNQFLKEEVDVADPMYIPFAHEMGVLHRICEGFRGMDIDTKKALEKVFGPGGAEAAQKRPAWTQEAETKLRRYVAIIREGRLEPMTPREKAAQKVIDAFDIEPPAGENIEEAFQIMNEYFAKPHMTDEQWLELEQEVFGFLREEVDCADPRYQEFARDIGELYRKCELIRTVQKREEEEAKMGRDVF